jgi:hypothetical protein
MERGEIPVIFIFKHTKQYFETIGFEKTPVSLRPQNFLAKLFELSRIMVSWPKEISAADL